jgi:alkylation response protein AidB-like acyl-CoA dehydrogenase
MDFAFTEEQEMLRKMARDFLAAECPRDTVRKLIKDEKGFTPELWAKMTELGWPGLIIPEQYGGVGGSFMDIVALVEEMGRGALVGPFFSSLVGTLAVLEMASDQQKADLLPKIASGKLVLTTAFSEPGVGYELDAIQCQATAEGDDWVINGTKLFVENAHLADLILVAAKTKHATKQEGLDLFLVDAKGPNVSCSMIETISGDKQSKVVIKGLKLPEAKRLGEAHRGKERITRLLEMATVLKCAEMEGGAQQVLDMTVTYLKERIQFDKPIGTLAPLQHHAANMAVDLEGMKYITYQVAWKVNENLPFAKDVAMAKSWCSDAYRRICDLAHQCHGAIGFCEDHDLPLYSKRSKVSEFAFGDAQYQRRFVAKDIGL